MLRMLRTLTTLFLCSMILTAVAKPTIKTLHPTYSPIQKSFSEQAKTHLAHTYTITMPLNGKLQRIPLQEGAPIKQGEVIAQLVLKPWRLAVKQWFSRIKTFQALYVWQLKQSSRQAPLVRKGYLDHATQDATVGQERAYHAQIGESKAQYEVAKYDLHQATIHSPINGIILDRYTQGGKWLTTGTQLLRLGNMRDLEIICDVLTQEAQQVRIGDPVLLTSIGSSVALHGKVKRIYPAGFTKKSSLGVDEQRVNIIIAITNPDAAHLGVGYRLQAQFFVGNKLNTALVVPRFSVLRDANSNNYVFKIVDKKLKKQIVQTGITTDTQIAIKSGITQKDIIVAQPTAEMHSGIKI